jgi:FKBP-type peptidyl-prolyl cis-trans isomerase
LQRLVPLVLIAALSAGAAHAQPAPVPAAPPTAAAQADFLAKNAKAAGVKTLPSGPAGPSPKAGDIIKVHYEGTLVSGQVFDSSIARGKPVLFPLADLVPAWMEAVPMMHVGDEWMLYVPPQLGYGPQGAGPIPPNSVLIFRIKLLGMLSAD